MKELRAAHAHAGHAPEAEAHLLFAALAVVAAMLCITRPSSLFMLVKRSSVIQKYTTDGRRPSVGLPPPHYSARLRAHARARQRRVLPHAGSGERVTYTVAALRQTARWQMHTVDEGDDGVVSIERLRTLRTMHT